MRGLLSLDQQHTPSETLKNAFHRLSIPSAKARQIAGKLMNEPTLHAWRSQLITLQRRSDGHFDYYRSASQRRELQEILSYAAQQHPSGLGASFLERISG